MRTGVSSAISPGKIAPPAEVKQQVKQAGLRYVSDSETGITRKKSGKNFVYYMNNKKITDPDELMRIKKLAIPPSWTNVWICARSNGHIQATGIDLKSRKQYKYHSEWIMLRNEAKFSKLIDFAEALPILRKQVNKDISSKEHSIHKVIALVIDVMEKTYIRIGNNEYEKLYGSYGLTTLKDHHVKIQDQQIIFSFKGKKGIYRKITLRNKRLARIIKQCRDIEGKELFQYYDESGTIRSIDSGDVNNYLKEHTGNNFTAKDFRTWAGTLSSLIAFKKSETVESVTERRKKIIDVLDEVSSKLGNTRSVCKKYYVHPGLLELYENEKLDKYLIETDNNLKENDSGLSIDEIQLLNILKDLNK